MANSEWEMWIVECGVIGLWRTTILRLHSDIPLSEFRIPIPIDTAVPLVYSRQASCSKHDPAAANMC